MTVILGESLFFEELSTLFIRMLIIERNSFRGSYLGCIPAEKAGVIIIDFFGGNVRCCPDSFPTDGNESHEPV